MSAIQLGALCYLLLCARAWPAAGRVPLTALLWRSAGCAIATLLVTATIIALVLEPLALLPLQWLVGAAAAGAAATLAVHGLNAGGARAAGSEATANCAPGSSFLPDTAWPMLVGAGLLPLLAAVPDPLALDTAVPQVAGMLVRGVRATLAILVVLVAFGGLCNRTARRAATSHANAGERLATVAVLALPIIGLAPWLGDA